MHPKDAQGIANSVEADQTAPLGTVWYGSALFAQTLESELIHPCSMSVLWMEMEKLKFFN